MHQDLNPSTSDAPALLTVQATARLLSISVASVWRRSSSGELPKPIKLGGRTLWRRDEIAAVIEAASAARDQDAA